MVITVPVLMDLPGSTVKRISTTVHPTLATTEGSAETVSTPSPATVPPGSQEADARPRSTSVPPTTVGTVVFVLMASEISPADVSLAMPADSARTRSTNVTSILVNTEEPARSSPTTMDTGSATR